MLNVGRRVFFAEGSAALDSTARATIRNQVQWLKANPQWKAKIQGFADDPGSDAQQTALSQKRADAVKNDMVSQGIAANRIWAKGYGRDRLVGDCAELECKAQNRRTVTNLQDGTEHNSVRPALHRYSYDRSLRTASRQPASLAKRIAGFIFGVKRAWRFQLLAKTDGSGSRPA